jgi:hypothetical protein
MHCASLAAVPALVAVSILCGVRASCRAVGRTSAAMSSVVGGAFLVGVGGTACFCSKRQVIKEHVCNDTITQVSV